MWGKIPLDLTIFIFLFHLWVQGKGILIIKLDNTNRTVQHCDIKGHRQIKMRDIWGEQVSIQITSDSISTSVRARNEKLKWWDMPTAILIVQKKERLWLNRCENPEQQEFALAMKKDEVPITCHMVVFHFSFRENEQPIHTSWSAGMRN